MKRSWIATGLLLVGCLEGAAAGQEIVPMPPGAHPVFEVAAIKLTPATGTGQGFRNNGNRLHIENETVKSMLMFAYGLQHKQIVGEPAWVNETAYDVQGVLDLPGEPSTAQWQEVLRELLAERYGLKVHKEKRQMSYFALRLAGKPKLVKAANPDAGADQVGNGGPKGMKMTYTSNSMDDFVIGTNYFTDRPVLNETGLQGKWDFTLQWMPDRMRVEEVPVDAPPGMFAAMKEQLGLKLEPVKGPVEVLVVDSVKRPSDN